jgi:hypothetical protein
MYVLGRPTGLVNPKFGCQTPRVRQKRGFLRLWEPVALFGAYRKQGFFGNWASAGK